MKVSTSFLSCPKILPAIEMISLTDTDYIHVDFIAGKFVHGKKIPFRKLKKIRKITSKRLDVHLMTDKLSKYIKKFALLNCEYITFHVSATKDILKYINLIHSYGIKCGLAIKPNTKVSSLIPYLPYLDQVLVMSVEPGRGGQEFIKESEDKINEVRALLDSYHIPAVVSVDGGVTNETINACQKCDMVVAGSYIVKSDNFQEKISSLR